MSSRRISKVNEAVRECVATEILCKLRDPRVKNVTVLRAETAADMRTAKVYVSVMGDEKLQALTMHGLRAAKGYLQSQLADRLQTRYTPVLTFILDQSIKRSIAASVLIREALSDSQPLSIGAGAEDGEEYDDSEYENDRYDESDGDHEGVDHEDGESGEATGDGSPGDGVDAEVEANGMTDSVAGTSASAIGGLSDETSRESCVNESAERGRERASGGESDVMATGTG
jgi:ribosome-binding factor A